MTADAVDPEQRIQELERENRLLREQTHQVERLREMAQNGVKQLRQARRALIESQRELQQSYETLELRAEELRLANETIERLAYNDKQVIENLHEAVIVTTAQGVIVNVNPAFERITGYTRAEVLGGSPRLLKSGIQEPEFYAALWERLLREGRWQGEVWNRRQDGEQYAVLLSISAIHNWNGEIVNFVGVSMEITALKRTQEALLRAKERAEAADRAKSAFLANVSHELRTPLNAISGHAQGLARGELDSAQRRAVEGILGAGDRLLTLIEDILALTKAEAGSFDIQPGPCRLEKLFDGLAVWFAPLADAKGLRLAFQGLEGLPPVIEIDGRRLRQIVANLLDNAIKYTESGEVRLEARVIEGDEPRLEVAVVDTGAGVAPERLPGLLLPQFGGEAEVSDYPETRLGLAVVQGITARMGGALDVVSHLGEGSRFTLALPFRRMVAARTEPAADGAPTGGISPLPPEEVAVLQALAARGRILEIQQRIQTLRAATPDMPWLRDLEESARRLDLKKVRLLLNGESNRPV